MNMKQTWLILAIFSLFLLFISACGSSPSGTHQDPEDSNQKQSQSEVDNQDNQGQTEGNPATQKDPTSLGSEKEQATPIDQEPARRFQVNLKNFSIAPVESAQTDEKFVLLTFDDTPTAKSTNQILDTLDQYDAKAIFFVNGHYAEPHLELLKEIKNRGHIIGNHTWWHIYIRKESPEKVRKEIVELSDFIEEHLGERPKYFRPPFGQNSDVSLEIIKEEGMQTMNWSNGSLDWELKTSEAITKQVLSNIKNGDNILFHDKQTTADALDTILSELSKQGYQFVLPTEVILPEIEQ